MKGGYTDQENQDWGHHEILFGIAGHAGDWREGQTDWQAYRLSTPLIGFETEKHTGALGKQLFAGERRRSARAHSGTEESGDERRDDCAAG